MELIKLSTEWAKAEVFSTRFFILFAILFLIVSIGFWQLGKTDLAKSLHNSNPSGWVVTDDYRSRVILHQ